MILEHLKDVVGRGDDHLLGPSVKIIACKTLTVWAMLAIFTRSALVVEDVEVNPGDQGVPERVLLVEEAGVGAGFDVVPSAPFVDDQSDPPFGS